MYTCRWFVLCENVVHSTNDSLSTINAIYEVSTPAFPALYPRFAFAAVLERTSEPEGGLALRFVREREDGPRDVIMTVGGELTPQRAQFFTNFPAGIRLFGEGLTTFHVEAREGDGDWYSVCSQTLKVSLINAEATPD